MAFVASHLQQAGENARSTCFGSNHAPCADPIMRRCQRQEGLEMLKAGTPVVYSNSRFWSRMRVQIGGGLLFSVLLPMAILAMVYRNFLALPSTHWAGAGVAVASLLSVYLLRNISLFPGIRSAYFVFPVVLTAYAGTFLLFLLLRLDYSRVVLISAGMVMLVWLYFVQLMIDRGPALRIGVVPGGEVDALSAVPSLELS